MQIDNLTRYVFFTGKGGVGKTSLATATAIHLADFGKTVLLVSTDPASNLDEILGVELRNTATPVPGVDGLAFLNIDPEIAADNYRQRVLAQMSEETPVDELDKVREELSGACTTEIAAFDEFATILAESAQLYDHVIFDTAPTGHTLRLLSLPAAWTGFLEVNERGASCLGPHSGLKMEESRFRDALWALTDSNNTTVILVTRPEVSAISEAARTAEELGTIGLTNQRLAVNGVFHATDPNDHIARSIERNGKESLAHLPDVLAVLPRDEIPLRSFDVVGLEALRALLAGDTGRPIATTSLQAHPRVQDTQNLSRLVDALVADGPGLVMVMGKGGVGKTTIAAALAIGLVERGESVHLSTTDPAAHLTATLTDTLPGLKVTRIDPKVETQKYIDKMMVRSADLDSEGRALLLEDLQSPCTEEVAVFHAFSHIVSEARSRFVVLDTAPTGHSLLLMDATGAYHRQVTRSAEHADAKLRVVTPLMRLQDASYTRIILVTLPETTPVSQAAALQEDLRRAKIEPYAWVINRSVLIAGTTDPLLKARVENEKKQMGRIADGLSTRTYIVPWLDIPPVGLEKLSHLVE